MPIEELSREYFKEMRMLARDDTGREVLVGLTYDESEWYLAYVKNRHTANGKRDDRRHYLELNDRHEFARRQIIAAEVEARNYLWNH